MRTTVYIPDGLAEALERHKSTINVSAILQEGLHREIRRLDLANEPQPPPQEILDRLRIEKKTWEDKWFAVGVQLGNQWARQARYESLKQTAEYWRRKRHDKSKDRHSLSDPVDRILMDEFGYPVHPDDLIGTGVAKRYPALNEIYEYNDEYDSAYKKDYDTQALARGWYDGVLAFWESVKDELS